MHTRLLSLVCLISFGLLAACEPANRPEAVVSVPAAEAPGGTSPEAPADKPMSAKAQATLTELLAVADRRSIRRLAAFARSQEGFRSNVGTQDPYEHWYLLKRAGTDVGRELQEVATYPYARRDLGDVTFYIWPYLAARTSEELQDDRLSFKERADLRALVGEEGLRRISEGEPYPGFRFAIRDDGIWAYFVNNG